MERSLKIGLIRENYRQVVTEYVQRWLEGEETLATRHIHGHPSLPDSLSDQVTDVAPVPRGSRIAPGHASIPGKFNSVSRLPIKIAPKFGINPGN